MRIAHLILAHKNPGQLERLLIALDHPSMDFYIHVDQKVDIRPFQYLAARERVFFVKRRIKVFWGEYSLVQVTINGLREILHQGEYGYVNVMSAQDFPLQPAAQIYKYLLNGDGLEFITCTKEEDKDEWWKVASLHVWHYNLHNWWLPGKYRLERLINRMVNWGLWPKRRFPIDNYVIAGRSQWFTVSGAAAAYALDFLDKNPKVVRFFKYVWGADEFVFSTILYNSPFGEHTRDNLQYIDWSARKASPKLLTIQDFHSIVASGKLFARKFDMTTDEEIITQLEAHLDRIQQVPS
jgi:hypothetical protein